jgi:two-component system nitrogen regulation response regulator NtrX
VRELRNIVERLVILVDKEEVDLSDLPAVVRGQAAPGALEIPDYASLKEGREDFERRLIQKKIREAGGNVTKAAELLGMERTSLHRKMKQYGIRADE